MNKPRIFTRQQIKKAIDIPQLLKAIEHGLILSATGKVNLAPISHLEFTHPQGEVHIKSAHIIGDKQYVIKIASGFPENPRLGISSSQGLMLLFSAITGQLETILLDEAYLTDLRTALMGAICCKYFAPKKISTIGIVGTGNQAVMQLDNLRHVTTCRDVIVWGRTSKSCENFKKNHQLSDFSIRTAKNITELCHNSSLIVTTTRSSQPLIFAKDLLPGVHITAVGTDHPGKQEIAIDAMKKADALFVDHLDQCLCYGDLSYAKDHISLAQVQEIGQAIINPFIREEKMITIADLTGVAVQDAQIAKAVAIQLENLC